MWDSQEEGWLEQYDALVAFIRRHGHAKVAKREKSLGRWVCSQRTRINQGKMTMERFMKLDAVGFVWASMQPTDHFVARIGLMRKTVEELKRADPALMRRYEEWKAQVSPRA